MDSLLDPKLDNFDASLAPRNQMLASKEGAPTFKYKKTGTTIAGLVFRDGVVIGADTRATAGPVVADKNCAKLHYISPNIYCAGAGTAADTDHVTKSVSYKLELLRLQTGRQSRIISAVNKLHDHLFRWGGNIGAYLILGGVDPTGKWLYGVSAEGTFKQQPYITLGSGSYCAMAEFEAGYKDDLSQEEAVDLVRRAIESGITNDLGSGSNVDVVVLTADGVDYRRNFRHYNEKAYPLSVEYKFPVGTAPVKQSYQVVSTAVGMDLE
mmetsp:Transcript_32915/g.57573  ORF Transcript_32915/g.57573 Transcript_32915/m.57573 type:complete len:267 (-) Transcript_32915:11082-11882(-)|eukprot:CAMPEP_0204897150 /NCGR_PEP_ID=MMETSP1397-20131031/571_1 /ASSEMBLY_ACC=CAM_ASM_000891 /TAXON_ID=49980 /ORGANISM="Climacostomum Climacostomum virens, Strain Stock W-24" /LENGTH=266 /DNA_ID=CAMNT_0052064863 /DNA_START=1222 /DNA_END=2022 /DNA_ORIENTATION=-